MKTLKNLQKMSTRSGKRIHSSIDEDLVENSEFKNEIKTRSKRQKENLPDKKPKHYVRYPSEETLTSSVPDEVMVKSTRKSKRHTLKEQNIPADSETLLYENERDVRTTRRTKKFDIPDALNIVESNQDKEVTVGKKKTKKKKVKSPSKEQNIENDCKTLTSTNKKKSNKKNKRKSNSFVIEEITENKIFNKSNATNDSFHSAAGSPIILDIKKNSKKYNDNRESAYDNNEVKSSNTRMSCDHLKNNLDEDVEQTIKDAKAQVGEVDNTTFENDNSLLTLNKSLGSSSRNQKFSMKNSSCNNDEINGTIHNDNENNGFNVTVQNVKLTSISPLNKTFDSISNNKKSKNSIISGNITALNATFEKDNSNKISNESNTATNDITYSGSKKRKSSIKNSTYDKIDSSIINLNTTYEKEPTINKNSTINKTTNESFRQSKHSQGEAVSSLNSTYNKNCKTETESSSANTTYDKTKLDTTFDKSLKKNSIEQISPKAKSSLISSDTTDNSTSDITDDNSRISITSDDSKAEYIVNTTPVLIESSMDESVIANSEKKITPLKRENTFTETDAKIPLRREGTYTEIDNTKQLNNKTIVRETKTPTLIREGTYDSLETDKISKGNENSPAQINSSMKSTTPLKNNVCRTPSSIKKSTETTPSKRKSISTKDDLTMTPTNKFNEKTPRRKSLPSPGCTPFPPSKSSSKENNIFNVTRSIEKSRRSSVADLAPRMTRVMFCSPVNNPTVVTQMKGKVIKSNLKGSNKSFVFEENVSEVPQPNKSTRKRSYTQSTVEDERSERERKAHQHSVERLSRARTTSASARLQVDSPAKKTEPRRTKLPNFAALHHKQFQRMESLDECQERKAKRARRLLTPTGATTTRTSPKESQQDVQQPDATIKKAETPKSKQSNSNTAPAYTRFGFKLNLDVNPFSIPSKKTNIKPKENRPKPLNVTLPSLAGTTLRREIAKQTIMREKSFAEKRNVKRNENRTVIKGVRTNRRFELQMKMRNILDK